MTRHRHLRHALAWLASWSYIAAMWAVFRKPPPVAVSRSIGALGCLSCSPGTRRECSQCVGSA